MLLGTGQDSASIIATAEAGSRSKLKQKGKAVTAKGESQKPSATPWELGIRLNLNGGAKDDSEIADKQKKARCKSAETHGGTVAWMSVSSAGPALAGTATLEMEVQAARTAGDMIALQGV